MATIVPSTLRNTSGILAFAPNSFRIENRYGNVYVEVQTLNGEHPATNKAFARRMVTDFLGAPWTVADYVGNVHYVTGSHSGIPRTARRYNVVYVGIESD